MTRAHMILARLAAVTSEIAALAAELGAVTEAPNPSSRPTPVTPPVEVAAPTPPAEGLRPEAQAVPPPAAPRLPAPRSAPAKRAPDPGETLAESASAKPPPKPVRALLQVESFPEAPRPNAGHPASSSSRRAEAERPAPVYVRTPPPVILRRGHRDPVPKPPTASTSPPAPRQLPPLAPVLAFSPVPTVAPAATMAPPSPPLTPPRAPPAPRPEPELAGLGVEEAARILGVSKDDLEERLASGVPDESPGRPTNYGRGGKRARWRWATVEALRAWWSAGT